MKKNKAFTFVELLVVVSILSIISVFSATSFMNFYKNQEFLTKIKNIETIIKNEDTKVITKEIFDYKAVFEKGKNYFLISKDISFLENYLEIKETSEGLKFDGNLDKLAVKVYENNRFLENITEFSKTSDYEFVFYEFDQEKLKKLKDEYMKNNNITDDENIPENELNKLKIKALNNKLNGILYYNFSKDEEYKLKLVNISREIEITKDSETPINTGNKLEIENVGGKKSFKLDEKNIKKVYLFFENEETGQIKYLQLNKD